ncbi:MAG: insulinase family protein, partial [Planctomycetota bacterium]
MAWLSSWQGLRTISISVLCLLMIVPLTAAERSWPQARSEFEASDDVLFGSLDNGLLYAIRANSEPPDKVSLRLHIDAGSLQEQQHERGMAHFLEHLAFNGSEHFAPGEMVTTLQEMGIAFGTHSNAHTGFEETVYKLDLPDPDPETIATALLVLSDTAGRLLLLPEEVERERGVILAELRDRDGPALRTSRALFGAVYDGTIIPERFPIGWPETIASIDAESMRAFYERWYRPDHMVLTVVGDIDIAAVRDLIHEHFAELDNPETQAEAPAIGSLDLQESIHVLAHHESEADGTRVALTSTHPHSPAVDGPERRRREVLLDLASRVFDRRLQELIENDREAPLLAGGMGVQPPLGGMETLWVFGQAKPDRALEAASVLVTEWRRLRQFGPTTSELRVAKANAIGQLQEAVDRAGTRSNAAIAQRLYEAADRDLVYMEPAAQAQLMTPLYNQADSDSVREVLRSLEDQALRALAMTGRHPGGEEIATALRQIHAQAMQVPLQAPVDNGTINWAYDQAPEAGTVDTSKELSHGIRHIAYANNAHVSLLPRVDKPNEIQIQLLLHLDPRASIQPGWHEFAARAFRAGGLGKHSQAELRVALAGTNAVIHGPIFEPEAVIFRATCTPDEFERTWQRLHAWLTDPGWRKEPAERARTLWLEELEALSTDLDRSAQRRFAFLSHGGLPQQREASADEVRALQWAEVQTWFKHILRTAPLEAAV